MRLVRAFSVACCALATVIALCFAALALRFEPGVERGDRQYAHH